MLKKHKSTPLKKWGAIVILYIFTQFSIPLSSTNTTRLANEGHHKKGTGVLTGEVKFADGRAVQYATVFIRSLKKHSLTDDKGRYLIKGIPFGEHTVETKTMEAESRKIKVVINKKKTDLPIILKENTIDLKEVVVQGKNEGQRSKAKGFSVDVLETSKTMLQSIQTSDLLDRTAGIKIRQDGGLGSRINYNINGLSGRSVKIFINGLPADNYGSAFSLNSIPSSSIERIEVYKGVVPAYLSQDALGGAVNIVLKQKRSSSLAASSSYGSFNTSRSNITGSYRSEKGFTVNGTVFFNYSDNNYRVYGPHIKYKDYNGKILYPENGAKRFHDSYESYGTQFNIGYTDVKWADNFLMGLVLSKNRKDVQHGSTMENVYGDRFAKHKSSVGTLSYSKRDILIEGLSIKLDASYSNVSRQIVDTVGIMYDWSGKPIRDIDGNILKYNSGAEVSRRKTLQINSDKAYVVRANLSYNINDNNSVYGNIFYNNFSRGVNDELQSYALQLLENRRDLEKSILAFTYENKAFSERLKSNVFFKKYIQKAVLNEPRIVGENVEWNNVPSNMDYNGYGLAISYTLTPEISILSSAEKAIRLPSESELFGNDADNVLEALALNPETSNNVNLGVNLGPYTFSNHSISLNTSIFRRDTRGMIRESIDQRGIYTQYENLENVLSKGIDAEFSYRYKKNLAFSFNISKFDVLFNSKFNNRGEPYNYYGTQIRNEPSLKFNTNISYTINNIFAKGSTATLYYNLNYVKGFNRDWANVGGTNLDLIPTQYPNDLGMSYTLPSKKTTFSLDAKNIFDQQIFDNFGLQKPGRAFYAKITYSFL